MRVRNPNPASVVSQQDKDELSAALVALGAVTHPTLAEIRAQLPAPRRLRATDGMIMEAALALGLSVMPE